MEKWGCLEHCKKSSFVFTDPFKDLIKVIKTYTRIAWTSWRSGPPLISPSACSFCCIAFWSLRKRQRFRHQHPGSWENQAHYSWRFASTAATARFPWGLAREICQKVDVVWLEKLQGLWWSSQLGDNNVHLEATAVDLGGKLTSGKPYWRDFGGWCWS